MISGAKCLPDLEFNPKAEKKGRWHYPAWPVDSWALTNTVVGAVIGCDLLSRANDRKGTGWLDAETASLVTGVPSFCIGRRMWAARMGHPEAWPWSSVSLHKRNLRCFLPELLPYCLWVVATHAMAYMQVKDRVISMMVERGQLTQGTSQFRNPNSDRPVYWLEDVLVTTGRLRTLRLLGPGISYEGAETFMLLSPTLLARIRLGNVLSTAPAPKPPRVRRVV